MRLVGKCGKSCNFQEFVTDRIIRCVKRSVRSGMKYESVINQVLIVIVVSNFTVCIIEVLSVCCNEYKVLLCV